MISAWRIVKKVYSDTAFSGEGAYREGGRWNHKGTIIVYLASSLSLSTLELLVHIPQESRNPKIKFISFQVDIPDEVIKRINLRSLPSNWREYPARPSTMDIGANWIKKNNSAVLQVPSVIIPKESNYLLNPLHHDFKKIKIHAPEPFSLDPRIT